MDNGYRFILAPLAGYTDKAFRKICTLFGAERTITEMVSAEGLAREGEKTIALMEKFDNSENLIVQLFAPSADPIKRAMNELRKQRVEGIDINCGCPVPKVVKTGAGSALMKEPEKIGEIVKVIREELDVPVSVKFRLGWDNSSINYLNVAEIAFKNGASSLTLHARTRAQGYEGKADRNAFKVLSEHFKGENVTLYASGDIFTAEDAVSIINDCNMDGVMFARGAIGNPFIFRETKEYLEKGAYNKPTIEERLNTLLLHYDLMEEYYGEEVTIHAMRKHALGYVKGLKGASSCKKMITEAKKRDDYIEAIKTLM